MKDEKSSIKNKIVKKSAMHDRRKNATRGMPKEHDHLKARITSNMVKNFSGRVSDDVADTNSKVY